MTKSARANAIATFRIGCGSRIASWLLAGLALAAVGCSSAGTTTGRTTGAPGVGVYVLQDVAASGTTPASASILEFSTTATGGSTPVSSVVEPAGTSLEFLATDGFGDIYTNSQAADGSAVVEYPLGSANSAPSKRSIPFNSTSGLKEISALSSDAAGDIYASNSVGGISIFSAAATGPVAPASSVAIPSGAGPQATAVDAMGNLYVATASPLNATAIAPIVVFAAGAGSPTRSLGGPLTTLADGSPVALATDSAGDLYVANVVSGVSSILVFGPGATGDTAPLRDISGSNTMLGCVGGIALDTEGYLYVVSTSACGSTANPAVLKFSTTGDGDIAPVSAFTSAAWTNADKALSIAVY